MKYYDTKALAQALKDFSQCDCGSMISYEDLDVLLFENPANPSKEQIERYIRTHS